MATPATIESHNLPVIALVGRVNVGKSTLFNRLIEEQKAIVSDIPGTTRTNNEGVILWRGKYIRIIDTGGLTFLESVPLEADIIKQTERAMEEADVIVFVTDGETGILPQEKELTRRLRKLDKPVVLLANKVDTNDDELNVMSPEWLSLGLGLPCPVSAVNGRNVGNFLDEIFSLLAKSKRRPKQNEHNKQTEETIRVGIIGRPNVGKSSLFNQLLGEEKVIVNPMAHTTREPHDTLMTYEYEVGKKKVEQPIVFVDTAGIRRKAQVSGVLEKVGIAKSITAAEESDIILFVLDGSAPISTQDRQLGGLLEKRAKSVLILLNKWDLAEDVTDHKRNEIKQVIYSYFPHLDFAPILFVSGLTGYRVHNVFPVLLQTWRARHTIIPDQALEQFLKQVTHEHRPSRGKGTRHPEIMGLRQLANNPPVFEILIKYRTSIHPSYINFLERRLREQFDFFATPIIIKMSKMKR